MIKIRFKNKVYEIQKSKIDYVLSILTGDDVSGLSDDEIIKLIEKYKLNDEIFFENVNKI